MGGELPSLLPGQSIPGPMGGEPISASYLSRAFPGLMGGEPHLCCLAEHSQILHGFYWPQHWPWVWWPYLAGLDTLQASHFPSVEPELLLSLGPPYSPAHSQHGFQGLSGRPAINFLLLEEHHWAEELCRAGSSTLAGLSPWKRSWFSPVEEANWLKLPLTGSKHPLQHPIWNTSSAFGGVLGKRRYSLRL